MKRQRSIPLAHGEETTVFASYRAGDKVARDRIFFSVLAYVDAEATRIARRTGAPREDVVSGGYIGVLTAMERFDVNVGVRFLTYASYWIRLEMYRAAQASEHLVRSGSNRDKAIEIAIARGERDIEALAKRASVTSDRVREVMAVRTERPARLDDAKKGLHETLASSAPTPEEQYIAVEEEHLAKRRVELALAKRTPRQQAILRMRFLMPERGGVVSYQAIGDMLGISRQAVRQVEQHAEAQLARSLRSQGRDGERLSIETLRPEVGKLREMRENDQELATARTA